MYAPNAAHETFQIGFSSNPRLDFGVYANAYFDAAEVLVESNMGKPSFPDHAVYPIMFLYRQAIELDLKACIYNTDLLSALMENSHLDHSLLSIHDLNELARRAKSITDVIFKKDQQLFAFMSSVVREVGHIMSVDPKSFAFRYPLKHDGTPSFSKSHWFGLESTREKMTFLHSGLQAIHFGVEVTESDWLEISAALASNEH